MPEIKLTIDCEEKLCGNCHFQFRYRRHCEAFSKDLEEHKISKRKKPYVRCQECIDAETKNKDEIIDSVSSISVYDLGLSTRSSSCLKTAKVQTLGELICKTADELAMIRNFGRKSLREINHKLEELGLELGMNDTATQRERIVAIYMRKKTGDNQ